MYLANLQTWIPRYIGLSLTKERHMKNQSFLELSGTRKTQVLERKVL